jgi:hypothetical protein
VRNQLSWKSISVTKSNAQTRDHSARFPAQWRQFEPPELKITLTKEKYLPPMANPLPNVYI